MNANLPEGKWDVVLADPPWDYYGDHNKWAAAGKEYHLISDDDMLRIPIRDIMNDPGVLFLWATCPKMGFAYKCIESWGLYDRGVAFVWVKTRKDGKPLGATGVRPSIVKPITEMVIAASTVQRGRPLPIDDESVEQTVFAPRGRHSEKPKEVHRRINRLYPDCTKIEIFARDRFAGFDGWGNELRDIYQGTPIDYKDIQLFMEDKYG